MFHYSNYWKTWSRVLKMDSCSIWELNLTPINGFHRGRKEEVSLEVIRCHGTMRHHRDIETDVLPNDVIAEMKKYLGEELTNKLLTYDYVQHITGPIDNLSNGGGVPLQNIIEKKYHYWT